MTRSLEDLAAVHGPSIVHGKSVWVASEIPEKKLKNAIESYAQSVAPERVLVLHDATVWGSASEGFLLTRAGFYFKGSSKAAPIHTRYLDMESFWRDEGGLCIKRAHQSVCRFDAADKLNLDALQLFLAGVFEARDAGQVDEVDGFVIVEEMDDRVKLGYLQVLIQMTWEDDGAIDQRELAELQTLMAQLNFSPELRHEARGYIANPCHSVMELLAAMDEHVPRGCEQALHLSLLKDLIRVARATSGPGSGDTVLEHDFIQRVADLTSISRPQMEVLESACDFDEQILAGQISDSQIANHAKTLAAKASAVGMPIAAVYLSGSVVGLSASGITSGLAALGLGGVLGLSSMVTGIGVVILLGVSAYTGVRWLTGGGERSKSAMREEMLQQVLFLNQRTLANMSEDINFFAARLMELNRVEEINRRELDTLVKQVSVFSGALQMLQRKGVDVGDAIQQALNPANAG